MPNAKGGVRLRDIILAAGPPRPGKRPKRRATAPKRRRAYRKRRGADKSKAAMVLTQGVGGVPNQSLGAKQGHDLRCWDARLPHHLPLPRAVGPYLTIRTTRRFNTDARVLVFGTFRRPGGGANANVWMNDVCYYDVNASATIASGDNTQRIVHNMNDLGKAATVCPSAMTVQIMNPNPLQSTQGMVYAGVMSTQAKLGGDTRTWEQWADQAIQFQAPRMMSAGKLAIRGVQISSYPLNMADVSDFDTVEVKTDGKHTWNSTSEPEPCGWAPIFVYNTGGGDPNTLELEYLVTTEWRVRFDLSNPASAGHAYHEVASDGIWNRMARDAAALGPGVRDIADVVSNAGRIGETVAKFM